MKASSILGILAAAVMASATSGCALFRASTSDLDLDNKGHLKADFDFVDMREISQSVADEMINSFLGRFEDAPIMMIAGVENRTSQYMDTKALTDRMRTELFKSGKAQFINETRRADLLKEQGYQAANVTPETQVRVGQQLGAKYMVSGSMIEMSQTGPREVRISKKREKYYKLTLEITDLETGLLTWTTEREFARSASEPLIGW